MSGRQTPAQDPAKTQDPAKAQDQSPAHDPAPAPTVRAALPWGTVYGLARTLIALGTAGTLAFSGTGTLFSHVVGRDPAPYCDGIQRAGAFCLAPDGQLGLARWLCVAVLLLVASGWRPRWTGVAHWYVAFSVHNGISIPDGGDQVAVVLTLLLIPVTLADPRRSHWQRIQEGAVARHRNARGARAWAVTAAVAFTLAAQLQVAGIYFQSSIAKLSHQEWADGTALYYWGNDVAFGAADWLAPLLGPLVEWSPTVALLTWSPLVIEFALAICLLMPPRVRRHLLVGGFALHLGIGLVMGLWSFVLVMWGALLLLCLPIGAQLPWTVRRATGPGTGTDEPAAETKAEPAAETKAEPAEPAPAAGR
ncbi:sporulation-delaying protein SdpB family protein [Streptomyces sp. PT12]|uniref:sporulation-delaying protein SdpB family protein n=1 Tax=Streptomyces sp. PT12 TaxID=1510197 RepID=UPI0011BEB437|nr:sporulation-delaying protein SdpB family protein [Streptomyces sp. PT12]